MNDREAIESIKKYVKLVAVLKKRPGMNFEDFQNYYENTHMALAKEHVTKLQQHNFRRYLLPVPGEPVEDREEDVLLEVWFDSYADMEETMRIYRKQPETAEAFAKDEEKLFDTNKIRFYIIDERHTDFSQSV